MPLRAVVALVLLTGCRASLEVPGGAAIACASDAECPEGFVCNPHRRLCVSDTTRDFEPPVLLDAELTPGRVHAGGTATLTLAFDAAIATLDVRLQGGGAFVLASSDDARATYVLTFTAAASDADGRYALGGRVVDHAGNGVDLVLDPSLVIDNTAPEVWVDSLSITTAPNSGNVLLRTGEAPVGLTVGGNLELQMIASEPLSAATVSLGSIAFESVELLGPLIIANHVVEAGEDGTYTSVSVTITDQTGNTHAQALTIAAQLFDTLPPPPPDVETAARIILERAPGGALATGHAPRTRVLAESGATSETTYVYAYARALDAPESPIARVPVTSDGGFPILDLPDGDRIDVYLRAIDAAGNPSSAVLVRDGRFVASSTGLGVSDNPSVFYEQRRAGGLAQPAIDPSFGEESGLGRADGAALHSRSAGSWRNRLAVLDPEWRASALMVTDAWSGRLYLLGGEAEPGCDGSPEYSGCQGLYHRENLGWVRDLNLAAESESLPRFNGDAFGLAYDNHRGLLVGYDGYNGRSWEWDGIEWRAPPMLGTPPDVWSGFMVSYHAASQRLVVFGGTNLAGASNGTWTWDGVSWTAETPPVSPVPRTHAVFVYDNARDVSVLVGGYADVGNQGNACGDGSSAWPYGNCYYQDTWEWNGSAWAERCDGVPAGDVCSTQPYRAKDSAAVYDPIAGEVMLYGGISSPGAVLSTCPDGRSKISSVNCVFDAVFTFDGLDWKNSTPPTGGDVQHDPNPRYRAALGYDPSRQVVVLNGGYNESGMRPGNGREGTYEWRGAEGWYAEVEPVSLDIYAREDFAMASYYETPFMFGGYDAVWESCPLLGTLDCSDTYILDGDVGGNYGWSEINCGAECPGHSRGQAVALDRGGEELVYFGGYQDDGDCDNDGMAEDSYCRPTWTLVPDFDGAHFAKFTIGPPARAHHAMSESPNGVYLFGGEAGAAPLGDFWEYTHGEPGPTGTWNQLCTGGSPCSMQPSTRSHLAMAYIPGAEELLLFGGQRGNGQDCGGGRSFCGDTWSYKNGDWALLTPADPEGDGNPAPRSEHRMVYDESRGTVMLYGGHATDLSTGAPCGDGSPSSSTWSCVYSDVWEWTGQSWLRVATADFDREGGPGRRFAPGLAHIPSRRETVLFGGNVRDQDIHLWYWQSGYDTQPAHVFEIPLSIASIPRQAINDVEVEWVAGGAGDDGSCGRQSGVELFVLRNSAWRALGAHNAPPEAPASVSFQVSQDAAWQTSLSKLPTLLLRGPRDLLSFAVRPRGATGCLPGRAEIASDYAEVRVSYRR